MNDMTAEDLRDYIAVATEQLKKATKLGLRDLTQVIRRNRRAMIARLAEMEA